MIQFVCDVCGCNYFIPLAEIECIQNKTLERNQYQLIKKRGTSTVWQCAKCGKNYGDIINIEFGKEDD